MGRVERGRFFVAALLVASGVCLGCREREAASPLPAAVRTVRYGEESIGTAIRYSATIKERQKVDLSFKVAGTVADLLQVAGHDGRPRDVQAGDKVPKGALIARLDEGDYRRAGEIARERLDAAKARLAMTVADAELGGKDLDRYRRLSEKGAATGRELEAALARQRTTAADADASRREVAGAEVSLRQAEDDLGHCTLRVPIDDATLGSRSVEAGERTPANRTAFLLLDVSRLVVAFGVPDTRVGRLAIGQPVEVLSDAYRDRAFAGRLTKIAPAADAQTRTFRIEVTIDEPGPLRPGMVATIAFAEVRKARLLPMTAVQRGEGPQDYVVFSVLEEGGRLVARRRRLAFDGAFDDRVIVRPGPGTELRDGEDVVVAGASRLLDGQVVRRATAAPAEPADVVASARARGLLGKGAPR